MPRVITESENDYKPGDRVKFYNPGSMFHNRVGTIVGPMDRGTSHYPVKWDDGASSTTHSNKLVYVDNPNP